MISRLRKFGHIESIKESCRDQRTLPVLETLSSDLRFALRMLAKSPGFTVIAVLTLALGIAANTAMFSVVNTVLLKPFAYPDPERIVMFQNMFQQGGLGGTRSPTEFNWWRQQTAAFQDVSAYSFSTSPISPAKPSGTDPGHARQRGLLPAVRHECAASAARSRPRTTLPNAPKTVVLAYAFWQRHFGGDSGVIGRRMTLTANAMKSSAWRLRSPKWSDFRNDVGDTATSTIKEPPDVYIPFQLDPNSEDRGHYFNVAGRLKPGVTLAEANAQLQASYPGLRLASGRNDMRGRAGFRVQPFAGRHRGRRAQFAADSAGRGQLRAADRLRECRQLAAGARDGPQT